MYYLRRFLIIFIIQIVIFAFISTIFIFNFNLERESLKKQSKQFTELIAKQAGIYFTNNKMPVLTRSAKKRKYKSFYFIFRFKHRD